MNFIHGGRNGENRRNSIGFGRAAMLALGFLVEEIDNPLNGEFNDRLSPNCGGRRRRRRFRWDDSADCGHGNHRDRELGDERCFAHKMFTI